MTDKQLTVPGRQLLAQFAKNPALLRAFEDLFKYVQSLNNGSLETVTSGAEIQAAESLETAIAAYQLAQFGAMLPTMVEQAAAQIYVPPVSFRDMADQDSTDIQVTGGFLNNVVIRPSPKTSDVPSVNGQLTIEATANTTLTFRYRGSDGVVRSVALTLA